MIRPLRQLHRATFVALATGLPVLLVLALGVRRQPATIESLPADLSAQTKPFAGSWNHADALLYWSAGPVEVGQPLPGDARLIGTVRRAAVHAPVETPTEGFFIVYSLATQEVVESRAALARDPEGTR